MLYRSLIESSHFENGFYLQKIYVMSTFLFNLNSHLGWISTKVSVLTLILEHKTKEALSGTAGSASIVCYHGTGR